MRFTSLTATLCVAAILGTLLFDPCESVDQQANVHLDPDPDLVETRDNDDALVTCGNCTCKENGDSSTLTLRSCDNVPEIKLSWYQISAVDPQAFNGRCTNVRGLNMSFNQLERLPSNVFADCSQLTALDLSHNQLKELPVDMLGACTGVQTLNNIDRPRFSAPYKHLEILNLSWNQLAEPANISFKLFSSMKSLQRLDLHENNITNIDILELPSLDYLDISCNNIVCLPYDVRSLPRKATHLCNRDRNSSCHRDDNPGCSKPCTHCAQSTDTDEDILFLPLETGKLGGFCMYNVPTHAWGIADYVAISLGSCALFGLAVLIILRCCRGQSTDDKQADLRQPLMIEMQGEEEEDSYAPHLHPRAAGPEETHRQEEEAFDKTEIHEDRFEQAQKQYAGWTLDGFLGFPWLFEVLMVICMGTVWGLSPWSDFDKFSDDPDVNKALSFRVNIFPVAQICVAILGFRFGYLGCKYINYALVVFHRSSIDDVISEAPEKIKVMGNRHQKLNEEEEPCWEKCKTPFRLYSNRVIVFSTYLLEFVTALQICLPVMTPYIRSARDKGQEVNQGVHILRAVNIDIHWGSETKFYLFLYTTIGFMSLLLLSMLIPIFLGEPWMMRALKLSRQAVCVVEFELTRFCSGSIGKCLCVCTCPPKLLKGIINCLLSFERSNRIGCLRRCERSNRITCLRRCGQPNNYHNRWWPKAFFDFMNLVIGFTFIPFTRHLLGLIVEPDMYPDIGGPSHDDDALDDSLDDDMLVPPSDLWKYRAALGTVICWYFLYSIVYCFAGIIEATTRSQVDHPSESKSLLLHPRFLYKMLFARLVILVFVINTGRKLYNGSYKPDSHGLTPSNFHVRFISAVVTWWIACDHTVYQRLLSKLPTKLQAFCKEKGSENSPYRDPMEYPSGVAWFNIRHRGTVVFVALFATLILTEYGGRMFPMTFTLCAASLFSMTVFGTELVVQSKYPQLSWRCSCLCSCSCSCRSKTDTEDR